MLWAEEERSIDTYQSLEVVHLKQVGPDLLWRDLPWDWVVELIMDEYHLKVTVDTLNKNKYLYLITFNTAKKAIHWH